ncbi:putative membrane protein YeiB [Haloactinospora alba]|uniref:Putative membrane protein YeiB n=1 Tax=Haloactinospora alba TaxID=405555 RepID=A0A543NNM4_9ACTN|nr:DUF418 domain-containing protein [Haloactinospora alba]TQN33438.1 putative membrane protein YeiB [Haloactinospora alba]
MVQNAASPRTRTRVRALDALRGFALCGIIFVNIPQTMGMLDVVAREPAGLRLFVHGSFYPVFYTLFGAGFGIFLRSAAGRSARPRVLLSRRLAVLAALGALHVQLQPGEVLLPFAIAGAVVLLPLSFAPPRLALVAGIGLTLLGLAAGVGGFGLLPGLFALGFALAELGVPESLGERRRQLVLVLVVAAVAAAGAYGLVAAGVPEAVGRRVGLVYSFALSTAYTSAFLLVALLPRGGAVVSAALAPLGRMALTNYLSATLLFVPLGNALGLPGSQHWGTAAALAAAVLALQLVWSPLWLRAFGFGPAEWAWRCATYWRLLPIRRDAPRAGADR